MSLIKKIFRQKLSENDLLTAFENWYRSVFSRVEREKPFLTVIFPSDDVPKLALNTVQPIFKQIAQVHDRKHQSRKLLRQYYEFKQEEICLKFFIKECSDIVVFAYGAALIDGGNEFLLKLWSKHEENELTYEEFLDLVTAYIKRKYYFEVYRNNVLIEVIHDLYGKIDNQEDFRRFEIIVKEHARKLQLELVLQNSKDNDVFSALAKNYDFDEIGKRSDLIVTFIQGVELNASEIVDKACSDFVELLKVNYETFNTIKDDIGVL